MAGGLFNMPPRSTRGTNSTIAKKVSAKGVPSSNISIKGGGGLLERIATITAMVAKNLGKYTDRYIAIQNEAELEDYISSSLQNGVISIDTETDSLDPITCTIAGFSLFTPGRKAAYVPLHHVSYITGIEVDNQIPADFAAKQLQRVVDAGIDVIMFNAKFDMRVIYNQLGVKLIPTWDGYIAARLLNENEGDGNNGLKALHKKYVLHGQGDAFNFESLFKGIPFTYIPVKTGYLYAARDAEITYELYEFQRPYLDPEDDLCKRQELERVSFVFKNIEMKCVPVVAEMEDNGICFDQKFADSLSEKYSAQLKERELKFYELCDQYKEQIESYKRKNPNHKLSDPIGINSPQQLAVLFYDILKVGEVDKKSPRGTGEDQLAKMDLPICRAVLDYREVSKLLSTYVNKLGTVVNPKTGRIHCNFNQIGADTGRFSSSEPNLQNIPSHNKEIRKMFRAAPGYVLLSSDFSAQEPRLTAHMSQDPKMIQAYKEGKDLYAQMASLAFDVPYEECLEFRPDGTKNPEGKERRGHAKAIFLGICYGKGVKAIGEDLHITTQKAQQVYDSVLKTFTGLKQFMIDSQQMAYEKGYVDTVWGRKRRLPDMQLEPYEFSYVGGHAGGFDPLFDDEDDQITEVPDKIKQKYIRQLDRTYSRPEKEAIKKRAEAEGIHIKDNGGFIAQATRQCVNSRIQGSAADQSKLAMIYVGTDQQLRDLGFKLLVPVHDELIGECPKENVKAVAKRFSELMVKSGEALCVPSKCDVEAFEQWNGTPLEID